MTRRSYFEATARDRVRGLFDSGSVSEFLPPQEAAPSPHLARLGLPGALDDGAIVGAARLQGRDVLFAAQEGQFMGGAVGELHGAKIVGTLARAGRSRPAAVVFMIDSGGVRLHEANAGLIAISEIMRAVLAARAAGVPVIALIGGTCGAFGGMGIVARLCSHVIMSEEGRLALSGPDVIETVAGVEEFDARDRALVWRVTGGKHRLLTGDCEALVEDDIAAFRAATAEAVERGVAPAPTLATVRARHDALARRARRFEGMRDGLDAWRALGASDAEGIPMLTAEETMRLAATVDA
ncbi:MAG: biotin-independent malonate decarboxylase subunit beta [Burkholderiales bacterium]